MSARALVIAAIASGHGKTTVTAALARQLTPAEDRVHVFTAGANFMDPLVLERACGHAAHARRSTRPDGPVMRSRADLDARAESL